MGATRHGAPLEGRTVVVTRPKGRAGGMVAAFRAAGARVILAPAVEIRPADPAGPFREAVERLDTYDWVVLTSAGAVEAVRRACGGAARPGARTGAAPEAKRGGGVDPSPGAPAPRRLAVVGRSTAAAARALGWRVDLMPATYTAEALLETMVREVRPLRDAEVLLLLADAAGDALPEGLRARGARVTRVTAYRTVPSDTWEADELGAALEDGEVDLLTFTSPSTAKRFLDLAGPAALDVPAAVIGPVTAEAAAGLGYRVVAVAREHTVDGLVAVVEHWLGST